jgi:hypothetical protein
MKASDKYTEKQLEDAFNLVSNSANWKYPIDISLPNFSAASVDRELIKEAVIFYTGSVPTFTEYENRLVVKADGYYIAVGA